MRALRRGREATGLLLEGVAPGEGRRRLRGREAALLALMGRGRRVSAGLPLLRLTVRLRLPIRRSGLLLAVGVKRRGLRTRWGVAHGRAQYRLRLTFPNMDAALRLMA
ncbi:hypothetical protein GCM10010468_72170 [Actinocorallia longicatena]|uniref:Uncharacterized protein n=1 Tax=Actinocorallia longicatena TaxID=111803 RepID=A0ABP6QLN3_9ACTN